MVLLLLFGRIGNSIRELLSSGTNCTSTAIPSEQHTQRHISA
jgi:hypothetical protein